MKTTKYTFKSDDLEFTFPVADPAKTISFTFGGNHIVSVSSFTAEFKMIGDMASADEWNIDISNITYSLDRVGRWAHAFDDGWPDLKDIIVSHCINHAQENIEEVWKSMGWKGHSSSGV